MLVTTKSRRRHLLLAAAAGLLLTSPAIAQGPAGKAIPGRYIVVLKRNVGDVDAAGLQIARAHGASFDHVYRSTVRGFAGTVPPGRLAALQADPRVAYVEPDAEFEIQGRFENLGKPGGGNGGNVREVVPAGVRRIYGAATIPSVVNVNVAILDTGIQSNHPDLNVVGGADFTRSRRGWEDGHGHGTHVAGSVAAKANGTGVVGVAPGARLHAVKVLDDRGSGQTSWVIDGIEWVAANAETRGIRVANMSLGGGQSQSILDALDVAVRQNVVFVVAAGNNRTDCAGSSPANSVNPGVVTVSALADRDGQPDGLGGATSSGADDTIATFSNNGRNETLPGEPAGNGVDVIAPGVDIYSTYKGGGYATMSGTSMASPHAAGVAALIVAGKPASTPIDVKLALMTSPGQGGWASYIHSYDSLNYIYGLGSWRALSGDLDSDKQVEGYEPLVNAAAFVP